MTSILYFFVLAALISLLCSHVSSTANIPDLDISSLQTAIDEFMAIPNDQIWSKVENVTEANPFFFFHQRKAGGSSIRKGLARQAVASGLSAYIACEPGVECDVYHIPLSRAYAVYGGHFAWGEQNWLSRHNKEHKRNSFSCTTNFREPTSRFISCLNYRFQRQLANRCLSEIPESEFLGLIEHIDEFGSSCLNEPFRIMSGIQDEALIDHLEEDTGRRKLRGTSGAPMRDGGRHLLQADYVAVFHLMLQHVAKCAPVVLEVKESFDLVNSRFPQLDGAFSSKTHENQGPKKNCAPLTPLQLYLIRKRTQLETVLYDAVVTKVKSRVEEVKVKQHRLA